MAPQSETPLSLPRTPPAFCLASNTYCRRTISRQLSKRELASNESRLVSSPCGSLSGESTCPSTGFDDVPCVHLAMEGGQCQLRPRLSVFDQHPARTGKTRQSPDLTAKSPVGVDQRERAPWTAAPHSVDMLEMVPSLTCQHCGESHAFGGTMCKCDMVLVLSTRYWSSTLDPSDRNRLLGMTGCRGLAMSRLCACLACLCQCVVAVWLAWRELGLPPALLRCPSPHQSALECKADRTQSRTPANALCFAMFASPLSSAAKVVREQV